MYAVVIHNKFVELVEAKFLFCKQHKYPVRMVSTHVVINCRSEEKTFSLSHNYAMVIHKNFADLLKA